MTSPPNNAREGAHLIQAERHIARCKRQIARQREIIELLKLAGNDAELAVSMLHALQTSIRAFERHRELILDRLEQKPIPEAALK
jgi:hypothetical protein